MEKQHTTHAIARYLLIGYVLIVASAAALILSTPKRAAAIEAPPESLLDVNSEESPDTRLVLDGTPQTIHTVPHWCGVNGGVKFSTGAVGTHTQGPIEIVISSGPPTAVTSVDTNSDSVIPYKIVVNGGGTSSATYTWPATVKNMTAPVINDAELPPNVSYVIVCYLEKKSSDQSDDTNNGGGTNNDDQGGVLGASTDPESTDENDVLGAETLAETGVSASLAFGTGITMIIVGLLLSRMSGGSTSYKA